MRFNAVRTSVVTFAALAGVGIGFVGSRYCTPCSADRAAAAHAAATVLPTGYQPDDEMDQPGEKMPGQDHGMSAEDMEKMRQYATPGENHKMLQPMVGTFAAEATFWMEPGAEPMKSTGTMVNTWVLGGRFLKGEFKGHFMNEPFEGIGYLGYDNSQKKYVGSWIDSMGTGMMIQSGQMDDAGKVLTMTSNFTCPMGDVATRMVTRVVNDDKYIDEMYQDRGQGEFKAGEIVYTRQK